MLNHISLYVRDLEKSKSFYSYALAPLGYKLAKEKSHSAGFGTEDTDGKRDFWIKAGPVQPTPSFACLAFTAKDKEAVDAFHRAALKAGGTDNGAPGYRKQYYPGYYAAYVFDPDGFNIEAVFDDLKLHSANP